MNEPHLILTLTASLGAAVVLGFLTHRWGLSPIVGYLLAGVLVGPYTPGFVADRLLANELAEIGVILLMFGVGLHFHVKDLIAVRRVAITGALCQSAVATALGVLLGVSMGWSWGASIVFGLALSVASTVVLTRVLSDGNDLHTPTGRIAIGWLIVEDIFTVLVLVLLPAIFSVSGGAGIGWALVLAVLKLAILVALTYIVGGRLIPWLLNGAAVAGSRELFTLTVLALILGIAVGSATLFGASMALGAFLAGTIVGQSEFSLRAASDALPMRDAFAVLFFVSVGMVFHPGQLLETPLLLILTLAIVIIGKPVAAFAIVTLLGYGSKTAIGVSVALAQIGEFSLILATVGGELGIVSAEAINVVVAVTIVSIALNPLFYRFRDRMESFFVARPSLWRYLNRRQSQSNEPQISESPAPDANYKAIIVGYGLTGQTVAPLLRERGIQPTIVETNLDTVHRIRKEGYRVVYGDATRPEVLEGAGIADAVGLVIAGPPHDQVAEIIKVVRQLNPDVDVLARAHYLREVPVMRQAGANEVFSGEGEVALAMTDRILRTLGASPEHVERERERIREVLYR